MNKHKILGIALILTAISLIAITGVAAANGVFQGRGPTNWDMDEDRESDFFWGSMHGFGWFTDDGSNISPLHDLMVESVSKLSGLTIEKINARIAGGEPLYVIATESGVTAEDYINSMSEAWEIYFADAVDEEWIIEEHYHWMLEQMQDIPMESSFGGCHYFKNDQPSAYASYYGRGRQW